MAVNATPMTTQSQKTASPQAKQMPPQLRAARVAKQRIIKTVILGVTLLFLFVPLVSMFLFTIRHPLSGKWSLDPWIAIFTGDGSALGADLTTLWSGLGTSLALCVVTVAIMLALLVPTMVIVHIRSRRLERIIEWVATLPLTIPAIVLVVGLGPIYRWLSADVLSTNPIWLCFAYVVLVMPFAFRALAVGLNSIDVKTLCEASRSLGSSWPRVFFRVLIPNLWQSIRIVHFHRRGTGRIHRRLTARPYESAGRALSAWPIQLPNLHRNVTVGTVVRRDPAGGPRSDFRRDTSIQGR